MTPTIPGCVEAGQGKTVCTIAPLPPDGGPAAPSRAPTRPITPGGEPTAAAPPGVPGTVTPTPVVGVENPAGSAALWPLIAVLVIVVVMTMAVSLWWRLHRRTPAPAGPPSTGVGPVSTGVPSPVGGGDARVIEAIIKAYDVAIDDEQRQQLAQQLAGGGVVPVPVSPGDWLDPRLHNVVGRRAAGPHDTPQTVASIERPGWVMAGAGPEGLVRPADITAWV